MNNPLKLSNEHSENTAALNLRSHINNKLGSFDLAAWVCKHACIKPGSRLMDLGCGSGQLLLRYGKTALLHGSCIGVDISANSIDELRTAAASAGYNSLETAVLDMDSLTNSLEHEEWRCFSHIVSTYSLYYSASAPILLENLIKRLQPDGVMLVVAPVSGNNSEWFKFLERAGIHIPLKIHSVATFLEREVLPFAIRHFKSVQFEFASNTVRLASPSDIEAYWRSNIYFDEATIESVKVAANEVCHTQGGITNIKHIGLVAMRCRRGHEYDLSC